jgi:IMP dehydrogenase
VGMPLIPANMDTVISKELANIIVNQYNSFPIFHRFCDLDTQIDFIKEFPQKVYASFGVNNPLENLVKLKEAGARGICIDIAHGHSQTVLDLIRKIKQELPDFEIIAGNVCTPMGYSDLVNAGADAVKVGIGCGGACSTRIMTGFGIPQFTAIQEISQLAKKLQVPIIADGGIKHPKDIALAIGAGASTVMMGNLFAKTWESAGRKALRNIKNGKIIDFSLDVLESNRDQYEIVSHYRGQASAHFQKEYYGGIRKGLVAEGVDFYSPCSGSAVDLIDKYLGGMRSAMTYGGARNIKEFQRKAEFVEVGAGYLKESFPRME